MSKSRAKGTGFENDVVEFLRENGFVKAKRLPFSSPLGDIQGTPIVLEAKNQKTMKLPEWLEQAAKSGAKAGLLCAVVHKRARKGTA
jgi:Holliday junction resolvase